METTVSGAEVSVRRVDRKEGLPLGVKAAAPLLKSSKATRDVVGNMVRSRLELL